jgi:arsenate reductase
MNVQVFGIKNNSDTRKALRFFSERRITVHFSDLKIRAASKGELQRFVTKFGAARLINENAPAFRNRGLHAAHLGADRIMNLLLEDPSLLQIPLVRNGNHFTVGPAESEWADWLD